MKKTASCYTGYLYKKFGELIYTFVSFSRHINFYFDLYTYFFLADLETAQNCANKNLRKIEFKRFANISSDIAEYVDLCDHTASDNALEKPIETQEKDPVKIKLEDQVYHLQKSLHYLNTYRLGDEIIDDEDESVQSVSKPPKIIGPDSEQNTNDVNTRNYQLDGLFARRYYFITNVR